MDVSVIVPCLNEAARIEGCLQSLIGQDYSAGAYEMIVADGGSTDGSRERVKVFEKLHPNVHLVTAEKPDTASVRNAGIQVSRYAHIALIDADCQAPREWLGTLVSHYQAAKARDGWIAGVGGSNIPPPEETNRFVLAIGVALDSYLGSFTSIQGRRYPRPMPVSSLSTVDVLYHKKALLEIACFDESLGCEAEDADINFRLTRAGYKLLFIPQAYVWHHMRPTPKTWLKNMFRYGKGRARLLKRYPRMWGLCYVLPLLFLGAMLSILLIPFGKIFFLSLGYFPALLGYAMWQSIRKRSIFLVFHVFVVYLIQHFGYAAGEMYGLMNPRVK